MKKQRALLTGGSRGIGAAILKGFASSDYANLELIATATTQAGVEKIEAMLNNEQIQGHGLLLKCDNRRSISVFTSQLQEMYPEGFDFLINNAGLTQDQLLLRMSDEAWDKVIQCNLTAVFQLTKYILRGMLKKRHGRIVNISSVSATLGNPGQANYSASKAGLNAFTQSVAREVASRGITCNCVTPGFVATDMTKDLQSSQIQQIINQVPLGRMAKPEEIAACVHFLLSEQAGYITGISLPVNGGLVMGGI